LEAFPEENKIIVQIRKREKTPEQLEQEDYMRYVPLVYICSVLDILVEDWYQTEV